MDANLVVYVALTLLGLVALAEWADPTPSAGAGCRVGYVYDGDTVELICGEMVGTARLIGLDAPELEARCAAEKTAAEAAKKALAALVRGAALVEVEIAGHDRYGRDLVRLALDGRDAAGLMIAAGHARAYHGGTRAGWC
jgi:endonuclease YncB( thermonuclease family)